MTKIFAARESMEEQLFFLTTRAAAAATATGVEVSG